MAVTMSRTKRRRRATRRPIAEPGRAGRRGALRLALVIAVLLGINLYVFLWRGGTSIPAVMEKAALAGTSASLMPLTRNLTQRESAAVREAFVAAEAGAGIEGRTVRGKVVSGDSLGRILGREGMGASAADELIRALSGTLEFSKIRPGQRFSLRFDASGTLQMFEFRVSKERTVRAMRDGSGTLKSMRLDTEIERR